MDLKEIAIIGGGIIGRTTAFYLAKLGHNVVIVDPEPYKLKTNDEYRTASKASLGVLMGHTFRRASGRSWKLRQRSMELWPELIQMLSTKNIPLKLETPLIQLARDVNEKEVMNRICNNRARLGVKLLDNNYTEYKGRAFPTSLFGGLISSKDGRINPLQLLDCLTIALTELNIKEVNKKVISLHRISQQKIVKWKIKLETNHSLTKDFVILCSGQSSEALLKQIGHERPMEPILGQAIQLDLTKDDRHWNNWPAVLQYQGINLIPQSNDEIIIGATVEPGNKAMKINLQNLLLLNGYAPEWLKNASVKNHWHGIRIKPTKQPAPLLENLEPGLVLNTAHYRNGFLLAPSCAEWVTQQI